MSDLDDLLDDPGYDLDGDAGVAHERVAPAAAAPASYQIPSSLLPPVGAQGTPQSLGAPPSCAAWSAVYGLASAAALRAAAPEPAPLASPAYIYMQVINVTARPCRGSSLGAYFRILAATGTPILDNAPYYPDCQTLIDDYSDPPNPPPCDARFKLPFPTTVQASDEASIKQLLVQNRPLSYGTRLYKGFGAYNGTPVPYVGSGVVAISAKTGKPSGHCMLIVGYDDTKPYTDLHGNQCYGAYLIQNSFGTEWGADGYVWMAYETFLALAQGTCWAY